jgi:hypothetical protein
MYVDAVVSLNMSKMDCLDAYQNVSWDQRGGNTIQTVKVLIRKIRCMGKCIAERL